MADRRPGRGGYVAAALVLALTAVGVVVLAVSGIGTVRASGITPVEDGTVRVGDEPLAVWTRAVTAPPGDGSCTVSTDGGDRVRLESPGAEVRANAWTRVAVTPESLPPGRYDLACDGLATDDLGVGTDPPVLSLVLRFVGALAVGATGVVVAIALVALTLWRRHRAARDPAAAR